MVGDDLPHDGQGPRQHADTGLSTLRRGRERIRDPLVVFLREARLDVGARQSLPVSVIDLAQAVTNHRLDLAVTGDDLRRLRGAGQRAGVDGGDLLALQAHAQLAGLPAPLVGQLDAHRPRKPILGGQLRSAVANQINARCAHRVTVVSIAERTTTSAPALLDRQRPHHDAAMISRSSAASLPAAIPAGLAAAVLMSALACSPAPPAAATDAAPAADAAVKKNEEWRAKHESDYRRDWVSIAGLFFLEPGTHTVGSAPSNNIVIADVPASLGRLILKDKRVRFEPAKGVDVKLKDQTITEPIDLKDDGAPGADELVAGNVRMVIHVSGDRLCAARAQSQRRAGEGFLGFTWFPIDAAHRVTGTFIKDAEPRKLSVLNTFGDLDSANTEGVIEFTMAGQTLRLRPFTTRPEALLYRVQGSVERAGNLRGGAFPLCRPAGRWHHGAGFQRSVQPAPARSIPSRPARFR